MTSPADGWCTRSLRAPAPAWHCPASQAGSQQEASKSAPTSCMVRTRPGKPPGGILCAVSDFVPDPTRSKDAILDARRTRAVLELWKVSDGEDNEGTCLRRRRRGARNRSGQACRQTADSSQGRRCGYGAGAAATPSAVQCQPHQAIDATSQRLSTKRCHSHRQRAARKWNGPLYG